MSSLLSFNVLATAMVVSSTILYLAFSKHKTFSLVLKNQDSQSSVQNLRSCLCSETQKRDSKKKKKKRVKFAENVKDTKGNGKEYRRNRENSISRIDKICRNEIPPNRVALYNGILRDRLHRIQCSY